MKVSRIAKVAGASLAGFCAVSLAADKANVGPLISQMAGFVGAFLGSLVAGRRSAGARSGAERSPTDPPLPVSPESDGAAKQVDADSQN
jgi:uncharacterized membrane protein YeaQ/YmgE (transglycosylase-associated protein family)